eukprot:767183-Hanusia_phi.AAC.2
MHSVSCSSEVERVGRTSLESRVSRAAEIGGQTCIAWNACETVSSLYPNITEQSQISKLVRSQYHHTSHSRTNLEGVVLF